MKYDVICRSVHLQYKDTEHQPAVHTANLAEWCVWASLMLATFLVPPPKLLPKLLLNPTCFSTVILQLHLQKNAGMMTMNRLWWCSQAACWMVIPATQLVVQTSSWTRQKTFSLPMTQHYSVMSSQTLRSGDCPDSMAQRGCFRHHCSSLYNYTQFQMNEQ